MCSDSARVHLSPLAEERFGIRTARASIVTREDLSSVASFCHDNDVVLLIARCMASDIKAAQAMERRAFFLMDTLVYYARNLIKTPIPEDTGKILVRSARLGEEDAVKTVATESFRGYFGHYHADERLERAKCDEVYPDWAYRSCVSSEVADEVLIAELDKAIVGFFTLRLNTPQEGEGILSGIGPAAQRRGIYRSFMVQGMVWSLSQGATRMVVSTQMHNIAVQKVWARLGFEPSHAYYTFHKWFD